MFESKLLRALKEVNGEKRSVIKDWIADNLYWPVASFVRRTYKAICRSSAYAIFAWNNYDWDHTYIWSLMQFKLKRVKHELVNGVAVHEDKHMKALDEAIEICGRLCDETYEDKYMDVIDKKYGEYDFSGDFLSAKRPNLTEENKAEYLKDMTDSYKQAHKDFKNDLNRLNTIMKLHSKKWWD